MSTSKLLLFAPCLLVACGGSVGRKIDSARVSNIQPCVTTERDLVRWFGEPRERGNENGFPTMRWSYAHVSAGGGETQSLVVALNQQGRVVQFQLNPVGVTTEVKDICSAPQTN